MAAFNKSRKTENITALLQQHGKPLHHVSDLDVMLERMSSAKVVMLGEASHGTHEYYTWRSYITKKLISEHGFNFIAVEGDWPDCYEVNRFIKHKEHTDKSAADVLRLFDRWPSWMWANWEIVSLCEWLHDFNRKRKAEAMAGFYGLDVYSLWDSLTAVRQYLQQNDSEALQQAEKAFRCFAPYRDDETSYAYAAQLVPQRCYNEVVNLLQQVKKGRETTNDAEEVFSAEQNALITVNAEAYYRTMIRGGAESWNVRDSHMSETLTRLMQFHGPDAKAIVWEHNTHIGDARATSMHDEGMYNIGELAREQFGADKVFLVGFGSYAGTVMAANSWGAPQKILEVPEARADSWEHYLHGAGGNRLVLSSDIKNSILAEQRIGHRAIGVVYRPAYEQYGNYVPTVIPERYDAFVFIDKTKALHPLHSEGQNSKLPETYPFGV
jgi:erythromycin esterase